MANANVTLTVHVIDDDDSFRIAMVRLLKAAGYAVRAYSSGAEFLRSHVPSGPGCILLDLFLTDESGLDVQTLLVKRNDNLPLIFISGQGSIPDTVRAMQAGAVDFLTKPVKKELLLKSIASAITTDQQARSLRDKLRDTELRYRSLSPRQRSVFEGVVTGKLNKQMAADLGVAERTIKAHRSEVMKKMRADSVAQLVHISLQLSAESKRAARRN